MSDVWPWVAAAALGAYHGLDPSMGWLFAVALGLQERSRTKLIGSLVPIGVGHLFAVGAVVLALAAARLSISASLLRGLSAAALVAFGAFRLYRPRAHPRLGGMRVKPWELALWSFMMATAHGAGLMFVPVLLGVPAPTHVHGHFGAVSALSSPSAPAHHALVVQAAALVMVHTAAMLAVMCTLALAVYNWIGLAILRRAWINLDLIWASALITAGVICLVI